MIPYDRERYCRITLSRPRLEHKYSYAPHSMSQYDCSPRSYDRVPKQARKVVRLDDFSDDKTEIVDSTHYKSRLPSSNKTLELLSHPGGILKPVSGPDIYADQRYHQTDERAVNISIAIGSLVALTILGLGFCLQKKKWWRIFRRIVGVPTTTYAGEWDPRAEEEMLVHDSDVVH